MGIHKLKMESKVDVKMMKFRIILLLGILIGACSCQSPKLFSGNKASTKPIGDFNCGGFLIEKNSIKSDSTYILIKITDCVDGSPVDYGDVWVKNKMTNNQIKLKADSVGIISLKLNPGLYSLRSTRANYNLIETPYMLFNANEKYLLNFYLGTGEPLIN